MLNLRYSLLSEGSSDELLLPVIDWSIQRLGHQVIAAEHAYFPGLPLEQKIPQILSDYPMSDILIIHRDGDGAGLDKRLEEIKSTIHDDVNVWAPIIPVRMTEAWFLHNEGAIRKAAGNPNGKTPLDLPGKKTWEKIADPKDVLVEKLMVATEAKGRRLKRKRKEIWAMRRQLLLSVKDFSPLIGLTAFDQFLADLEAALNSLQQAEDT